MPRPNIDGVRVIYGIALGGMLLGSYYVFNGKGEYVAPQPVPSGLNPENGAVEFDPNATLEPYGIASPTQSTSGERCAQVPEGGNPFRTVYDGLDVKSPTGVPVTVRRYTKDTNGNRVLLSKTDYSDVYAVTGYVQPKDEVCIGGK